jgi:hypothetical protein
MAQTDLIIQQKWEDMAKYAYIALRHMPKSERFTLGTDIRAAIWRGLALIMRANFARNKLPLQIDLDHEVKCILAMLRVAHAIRVLPTKKYEVWSGMLVEIGRMVGGWIKSSRRP